jgi:TPR repeat protein
MPNEVTHVRFRFRLLVSTALTLGPLALLLAACAAGGDRAPVPPAAQGGRRGDELLPVDCLLPPQIRQLGTQATYLTARRAIKTTGRDCEIRGGEYVAYDRANYATALKVWLPLAEGGDLAAQNNVGEIYEKGLGVQSDYQAAALWYRRAADKGYSRAAINMGNLYEQGLGVPKDKNQAFNWYRKASGLSDVSFGVAPAGGAGAGSSAEEQRLRAENARLQRELATKQNEVTAKDAENARKQRENDTLRASLEQRGTEATTERGALAKLRADLDASRKSEQAAVTRARDLEKSVTSREAQLAARDKEVGDLRAALARSDTAAASKKAEVDRLQERIAAETGTQRADLERQQRAAAAELAKAQAENEALRKSVAERGRAADTERGQLTALRQDLDTARRGEQTATARLKEQEKSEAATVARLATKEKELVETRARADKATREATAAREDAAAARAEVARLQQQQQQVASAAPGSRNVGGADTPRVGVPRADRASFGNYHALVIGNNNYRQIRKLRTAVNDAREVAAILEKNYGFKVTLLLDADRYQILSALNSLRERLTEKDNLLIYYAGHGVLDLKNNRGHWLPVDAEPESSANWISNVAVSDILNAMSVQQLLVVADSCYAGTLSREVTGNLPAGVSPAERLKIMQQMAQKRSRMVMTSGGVEPVLDSTGGIHSAFAQTFIELLRANVGAIRGREMFSLLQDKVATTAMRLDTQQTPEYAPIKFAGHEAGDFIFVRASN